jgi:hypothetical protein
MLKMNNQSKQKIWIDEAGTSIPISHIKKHEKVHEKITASLAAHAMKVSDSLAKLKEEFSEKIEAAFKAFIDEQKTIKDTHKGNITVYNFDRSVKIERRNSEPIQFDDMTIQAAKEKLEEFLKDGITAKDQVIKDMVLEAFSTARGKLDVKKILGLKRHADRIKDQRYHEAMKLIDQAIRRPDSATYYRVWIKNERGEYQSIPLDLAAV